MQTGQSICNCLKLPGMDTCNRVVDILNARYCRIYQQPELPVEDVSSHEIKLLGIDVTPIVRFPEEINDGLRR